MQVARRALTTAMVTTLQGQTAIKLHGSNMKSRSRSRSRKTRRMTRKQCGVVNVVVIRYTAYIARQVPHVEMTNQTGRKARPAWKHTKNEQKQIIVCFRHGMAKQVPLKWKHTPLRGRGEAGRK